MKNKGKDALEWVWGHLSVSLGTVKGWDPPQDLADFCEEELGMEDDTPVSSGQLMEIGEKADFWVGWIVLKAIIELNLEWSNEILIILICGNFEYLDEELAEVLTGNKDSILPCQAAILARKIDYVPELLRVIDAFELDEYLYRVLINMKKPRGWEKKIADVIISRKHLFGEGQACKLIEKLLLDDLEQSMRAISECGISGKEKERLLDVLQEHHEKPYKPARGKRRTLRA